MECSKCGEALRSSPNEDGHCKACIANAESE